MAANKPARKDTPTPPIIVVVKTESEPLQSPPISGLLAAEIVATPHKEERGKASKTTVPMMVEEEEGSAGETLEDRQHPLALFQITSRSPPTTTNVVPTSIEAAPRSPSVELNLPIDWWKFRKKQRSPKDGCDHEKSSMAEGDKAEKSVLRQSEPVADKETAGRSSTTVTLDWNDQGSDELLGDGGSPRQQ
ncbi:unnamed protein product [Linum trigynum]